MTYLSDRKKQYSKWTRIIMAIVFFIVLSVFWKQIRKVTYPVVIPVVSVVSGVVDGVFYIPSFFSTYITFHKTSSERIDALEKNIELLENKVASQNGELEQYIAKDELKSKVYSTTLEVYPIAQDLYFLYSTMLITKGFSDGIEEGMIVYTRGYEAVGIVTQVYGSTALVSLLSASGNKVDAFIQENKMTLSLVGAGGGNFTAQIPKDLDVVIGDNIFLTQNPTMNLGTVVDIVGTQQDFFKTVYIRGAYNPAKQRNYFVDK